MVKYVLLVCVLFNAWLVGAQTAYVVAPSGLKLRKTADAKAEVVKTLAYSTKVNYVVDSKPKVAHKTKEAEGFYLNGYWQKVVAGNDTGYVFEAFLLPFEPMNFTVGEDVANKSADNCQPEEYLYFEKMFKKVGGVYDIEKITDYDTSRFTAEYIKENPQPFCNYLSFKQKFDPGIVFEYSHIPEKMSDISITFTGYDFNKVYSLVLSYTIAANSGQKTIVSYKNKQVEMVPGEGVGCYSTIKVKGNAIIWNYGCGC